jgi:asparagine synthase (glutamine-hydrolysing)
MSALLTENQLYSLEFKHYRFEPFTADFQSKAAAQLQNRQSLLGEIKNLPASRLSNFLFNLMHSTSIQTLLHYEDRMAMAHGVESRVPFLDHRLVKFAFSLPSEYKIQPPFGKYVHREAMQDIIPPAIYNRKDKAIFSSPFYSVWLKDRLSPYIAEIFNSAEFRQRGIYNLPLIEQKRTAFKNGSKADGEMLFNLLALETWFRTFKL